MCRKFLQYFFFSSINLPVISLPSALVTHICQVDVANCLQYDMLFARWFQWQWRKTCGTVCRRTRRVVKQKMGHRHKHQRDQTIVSPSKYTEFSFLWLNTDTHRDREWHNHALERHIFSCFSDMLLMPSCCQSVYCIFKMEDSVLYTWSFYCQLEALSC